ncbi:MAG: lysylphosphatidylglycerol synthase transmembrane domain-containing protein [bacterium]
MSDPEATLKTRPKKYTWLWRIITALVSVGILYWFFRGVSWHEVMEAASEADYLPAWLGMIIPVVLFWISDSAYTVKSFEWFHKRVPLRDYFVIKAAAYLLAMINIAFATGGVFYYFIRKTGITVKKQVGILAWRELMVVFGCCVFFGVLAVGVFCYSREMAAEAYLNFWGPVLLGMVLLLIEFWRFWSKGKGLLFKNLPLSYDKEFWQPFHNPKARQWLKGMGYMLPAILAYCVGLWITARAFDVYVPFITFMFWIPLVALISALPVAFSNFGTTTAAWVAFFAAYGDRADIAVLTIFIPAARLIIRAVIGGVFVPWAMKELETMPGYKRGEVAGEEKG